MAVCAFPLVFALPYIVFLSIHTGELRFEAKTPDALAYALGRRTTGKNDGEIYYAIDTDLAGKGSSTISNLELVQTTAASVGQRLYILLRQAKHNLPVLFGALGALYFGQPFLGMLVALGLFGTGWSKDRLCRELPLLAVAALTLATFATWPFFHDRFIFPLLPPLIVWGGEGLRRLQSWASESAANLGWRRWHCCRRERLGWGAGTDSG